MEELKSIQKELDKRTKLESEVIELISQCRFTEANELMKTF